MADLLNIGVSGLMAFQRSLATTSHNIANVNTEGYSRQSVELGTRLPERTGAGYIGQGVNTLSVQRQYDTFLVEQVRHHTALNSRLDTYYTFSAEVDNLLADPDAGLAPTMEDFFGAVYDLSNDPTSGAARQVLLASGEALSARFNAIDQRLTDLQSRVNRQMQVTVDEVNQMAEALAKLNTEIVSARGAAGGQPPNDLLDRRDLMLEQLAERVKVSVLEQSDGMVSVFVGTGQALVVGPTANKLTISADPADATRKQISMGNANVTNLLTGGKLGGLVDFESEVLHPTRQSLGRVALAVADTFNEQHRLGMDMNGDMGGDFFRDLSVVSALGNARNASSTDYQFEAVIRDVSKLPASDYRLDFENNRYTLTRLSDGKVVGGPLTQADFDPPPNPSFDLSGTLDSGDAVGTVVPMSQFTIKDDMGVPHTVDVTFQKTAANEWQMTTVMDGDPDRYSETTTLTFDAGTGDLTSPASVTLPPFAAGGRASDMSIEIDLSGLDEQAGGGGVASSGIVDAQPPGIATDDGFYVRLDSGSSISEGDSFLIRPSYNAAYHIGMELWDPAKIAAASPVSAEAALTNLGKATITPANLTDASLYDDGDYTIVTTAETTGAVDPTGTAIGAINDDIGNDNQLEYQLWLNGNLVYSQGEGDPVLTSLSALRDAINDSPENPGVTAYVDGGKLLFTNDTPSMNPIRLREALVDTNGNALDPNDEVTGYFGTTLTGLAPEGETVAYTSVDGYLVTDSDGNILSGASGAYNATGVDIEFRGVTTRLSGEAALGDTFSVGLNPSGVGDNRNALALGNLQTKRILDGVSEFQTDYAGTVAKVGTKTHLASLNAGVEQTMLNQAIDARDAVSGVNLDEEAAKLLAYQQAYMASTKMITVADNLFQTLLGAVGR